MAEKKPRDRRTEVEDYLSRTPSDEETARRAVEPYRDMSVTERFAALTEILAEMDAILAGRMPVRTADDENFWRHWVDPMYGQPR
jgi:hypothetical protein